MSDELVAYLRERLDEEEALAHDASGHPIFDGTGIVVTHYATGTREASVPSHVAAFLSANDPARALGEIAAKRRLLDLHVDIGSENLPACKVCDVGYKSCGCVGWDEWPCETLKVLASPYSGRSDFRQEWRLDEHAPQSAR